jgi:hypothetical protein
MGGSWATAERKSISTCYTLPHVNVRPRGRRMAVNGYVGFVGPLAGKAWPSGDHTFPQWTWHRPKPPVSRHHATGACRRRSACVIKIPRARDPSRTQLRRHDHQRRGGEKPNSGTAISFPRRVCSGKWAMRAGLASPGGWRLFSRCRARSWRWLALTGRGQLDLWGLHPGEASDFVRARLCDFSLRCFENPLPLPANRRASIPATFVTCVAEGYPARPFFEPFARKARASGWEVAELKTGHDCHVERPDEVANILLSAAKSIFVQ